MVAKLKSSCAQMTCSATDTKHHVRGMKLCNNCSCLQFYSNGKGKNECWHEKIRISK